MPTEQRDLGPATPGLSHQRQEEAARVVRDVLAGTLHLRKQGERYLPKFPKEQTVNYEARLEASVLFNATKRTKKAFAGMVFRKEPVIGDDVPPRMLPLLENVDMTGRDLATFSRDHFEDALADGHCIIFVDMQPPADADSAAEEAAAGLRPYWISIRKQDVLAFETANVGGRTPLVALRYREQAVKEDGRWKEMEVHRIREYWLSINPENETELRAFYNVWELDPEKEYPGESADDWKVVEGWESGNPGGMMGISRIPVAATYTSREGVLESTPPFLDLALENIKHYQDESDNRNLARTAKVQTLVFTGETVENIQTVAVGPGNAIVLSDPEADAKWIGADGSSFKDFAGDLENIEKRMAVMGLSMLMSESRAAETAASKRIDKAESDSQLAAAAKDLQRAIKEALSLTAEWLDLDEGGHVGINTDFDTEPLDSATFREFRELWAERGLSWETLMRIAQRGEILPEGFDVDEERERIEAEAVLTLTAGETELFGEGETEAENEDAA